ncbi:T9SS type A sorting domain-containing protein, partial [Winogradskyella sp.]|uniref:T9SS type A sorting domain-containing protein n=1 Tax=Winogradskyella sp. TaxID=1883156 RepID=UPI002626F5CF
KEEELQRVSLYPNPANDKLEITSRLPMDGLSIMDINGRELDRIEVSTKNYTLDVSSLSKGIYFLKIQSREFKSTQKFIKN